MIYNYEQYITHGKLMIDALHFGTHGVTLPQIFNLQAYFIFVQETIGLRQCSLFIHMTTSVLARLCALEVCVFASTFPGLC